MKKAILFFLSAISIYAQELRSEEVLLENGTIKLPGTLSYRESSHKLPLVIFVPGSGNVDRNGNQGPLVKADYIKSLAHLLNKEEIAFFRFDKRTSNPENFNQLNNISFYDFVGDVQLIINHFSKDQRFNGIHLIGHSQGSLVAMLCAKKTNIASYISIAGAGTPIDLTLVAQLKKQNETLSEIAEKHITELKQTDTIRKVNPLLIQLFAPQNQKFLKEWMLIDPVTELSALKIPILIVQGNEDLQVSLKDAEHLEAANPKATLKTVPRMNHILKEVANFSENQESYSNPKFAISKQLVAILTDFIRSHE